MNRRSDIRGRLVPPIYPGVETRTKVPKTRVDPDTEALRSITEGRDCDRKRVLQMMGGCSSRSNSNNSISTNSTSANSSHSSSDNAGASDIQTVRTQREAMEQFLARPERSGKWFIAHRDTVHSIDHQARCDIWSEFLSHHPNGSRTWSAFVLLQLTDLQLERQSDRVRVSSYRWRDVRGVGPDGTAYQIPGNCGWFLEYLQQHKLLGWVDWVANMGANVPITETLGYMGALYARHVVTGEWLFGLHTLESALSRGWIVQEQSFGPLDPIGVKHMLKELRDLGLRWLKRRVQTATLVKFCNIVAQLLVRRGYKHGTGSLPPQLERRNYLFYQNHYPHGQDGYTRAGCVTLVASRRHVWEDPGCDDIRTLMREMDARSYNMPSMNLLDVVTIPASDDKTFSLCIRELEGWLCVPSCARVTDFDTFTAKFHEGTIRAYLQSELTVESDRQMAITSVARSITSINLNQKLDACQFIAIMWMALMKKLRSYPRGSFFAVPHVAAGLATPWLGMGGVRGTKIVRLDRDGDRDQLVYRGREGGLVCVNMSLFDLGRMSGIFTLVGGEIMDTHGRGVVDVYICSLETPEFYLYVTSSPQNPCVPLGISFHFVSYRDIPADDFVFNNSINT